MKNRVWIVAVIILVMALACGIGFWKEVQTVNHEEERLMELWNISTLAENKGADWATDELMINNIESFRKKSLYKKWGKPTETNETANEDIWILSDDFQLIVDYKDNERVEKVRVVPIAQTTS